MSKKRHAMARASHNRLVEPKSRGTRAVAGKSGSLDKSQLLKIHDLMVKARVLEERLIRMYKQSDGYFWIGGPGEEAFNISLGLQVNKGQGIDHDFLHLHYRAGAIVTAMGMEPIDSMRQMKNTASDPYSGGRNFANHFSRKEWNVVPVTSTIETQLATAIGTGLAQMRQKGKGITIVTSGDAGSAEGEFASNLIWSSRPGSELPILNIVMNNSWGISTPAQTQHGEKNVADRAAAFGIEHKTINGNDVEEAWNSIKTAMKYVREKRKPYLLEARVSRLYGHSSASGANFVSNEEDPIVTFENQLEKRGHLDKKTRDEIWEKYTAEMLEMAQQVKQEPLPDGDTIYDYVYANQKGKYW